jgi:hypothetical protein
MEMASYGAKIRHIFGDTFSCRARPPVISQEAQARFARARLCLPYNEGRKETLRPK